MFWNKHVGVLRKSLKECVHKTLNQDNTAAFYLTACAIVVLRWDGGNVSPYIDIVLL